MIEFFRWVGVEGFAQQWPGDSLAHSRETVIGCLIPLPDGLHDAWVLTLIPHPSKLDVITEANDAIRKRHGWAA